MPCVYSEVILHNIYHGNALERIAKFTSGDFFAS